MTDENILGKEIKEIKAYKGRSYICLQGDTVLWTEDGQLKRQTLANLPKQLKVSLGWYTEEEIRDQQDLAVSKELLIESYQDQISALEALIEKTRKCATFVDLPITIKLTENS